MATVPPPVSQAFYPGPARARVAWGMLGAVLVALVLHLALFALLSVLWRAPVPPPAESRPVEVSLVDAVALDAHAPPATEAPSRSTAPEAGPPDDAPPPAPAEAPEPEPMPPEPAPPRPAPKPAAKPAPAPKPAPRPAAAKPERPVAKPAPEKSAAPAARAVAAAKGDGSAPAARAARRTGSLLDDDFRKGLTQSASPTRNSAAAPGATMNAAAAADIGSAIRRQVQPCADRQVNPGPGASRIVVTIRLALNRDGSLAARPSVSDDHGGVDDENRRYVDAVDRNAIATFTGCAPLKGLPDELYDVPRGWKTFILRYKLPG